MFTKMRKSMIIVALAVIICLIAATLSVELVRTAYAQEQNATPVAEYQLENDSDWSKAIVKAQTLYNQEANLVKITLSRNWIANNGSLGSGVGFEDGHIVVPSNANILLDLNGKVIDRALNSAQQNGVVIDVKGSLTICDSDASGNNAQYSYNSAPVYGGIITGGNSAGFGGAISVAGGAALTVNGGTLLNNVAAYGGGIGVYRNGSEKATVVINGGAILGNYAFGTAGGGGLYIANANLTIGGENSISIEGNRATKGGAIAIASADSVARLSNVVVSNNSAVSQGLAYGGGVYVKEGALIVSDNAEITNNSAVDGGGVYVSDSNAKLTVIGNAKIYDNKGASNELDNVYLANGAKINVGTLNDANIYVSNVADKEAFTVNYANSNSTAGYAENPVKYFTLDNGNKVLLNSNGEAVSSSVAFAWGVKYDGDTSYTNVEDYGVAFDYNNDGRAIIGVKINGVERETNIRNVADSAVINQTVDGVEVAVSIIVNPKSIEGMNVTGIGNESVFSILQPHINIEGLQANRDYTVTFNDNRFVSSNASITVTGMGNYTGKIVKTYSIVADTSKTYTIAWEYFDGSAWVAVPANAEVAAFDGAIHNDQVRAKLTIAGETSYVEYAYARNVVPQNTQNWNSNLYIVFNGEFAGANVTDLLNATTYVAGVEGNGNVAMPSEPTTQIKIAKAASLSLSAGDFANETDEDGNPLWLLYVGSDDIDYIGANSNGAYQLLSGDGLTYVNGTSFSNGDVNEKYARYTGGELKLVLNGNYKVNGESILSYLQWAQIAYTNKNAVGEINKLNKVTTTVTVTIADNYIAESQPIVLSANWNIVTVNNALRTTDGNEINSTYLGMWTYGDSLEDYAISKSFRPEHGDTVILTFTKKGSDDVLCRFAIVYGDSVSYYEVKQDGGKFVADLDKAISSNNYYIDYLNTIQHGEYVLNAYIPEVKNLGQHNHWWGGNESMPAQDYETYCEVSCDYTFVVSAYEFVVNGTLSPELYYTIVNSKVAYNGNVNNTPEIELRHINGRVFIEGVDYELLSENKNVGTADLTIKGIGSLRGEVTLSGGYEIVKAVNRWLSVPIVVGWDYKQYNRNVNIITATPELLDNADDLWFMIASDVDGNNAVQGLEQFRLTGEGVISDVYVQTLTLLPVGRYYLFAFVDGNDNYQQLSQAGVPFDVAKAVNTWKITPGITTWIEGQFNAMDNLPYAEAVEGNDTAIYVITDVNGNVVYDSANGISNLAKAPAGIYNLTVTIPVDVNGNYSELTTITPITFSIYPKAGLPWWAVLALVVGALLVAALMLFILAKLGVFQVLTRKLTVAIRTKATVDATIAAVRANKVAAEARKSVAAAKARDRAAKRKAEREAIFALPAEERAQALALKAKEEALRAERMRAKANEVQAEAEALRRQAEQEIAAAKSKKSTD